MLKLFLASLSPLVLALPLLVLFADDAPRRPAEAAEESAAAEVDSTDETNILVAMAPPAPAEIIISRSISLP